MRIVQILLGKKIFGSVKELDVRMSKTDMVHELSRLLGEGKQFEKSTKDKTTNIPLKDMTCPE